MQPRIIRLKDAPAYLGMNKNMFNKVARPHIAEMRIGDRGIGFDRLDLDLFLDYYKSKNLIHKDNCESTLLWQRSRQGSSKEATHGTLTRQSTEKEFAAALAQAVAKKPNKS